MFYKFLVDMEQRMYKASWAQINIATGLVNSKSLHRNSLLQDGHQGADGFAEPGSIPAVQHPASPDPGSNHPAPPDTLLADHSRVRIPCHRCRTDSCSG